MPALLIRHHVADYPNWKTIVDELEPTRRANGSQEERLFREAVDPFEVTVLLPWDDLERARLVADSDDLHEAGMQGGITDRPTIWFLENGDSPCI